MTYFRVTHEVYLQKNNEVFSNAFKKLPKSHNIFGANYFFNVWNDPHYSNEFKDV
jgi:hypothetical protein